MPTVIARIFSTRAKTVLRHRRITGFDDVEFARVVSTAGTFPLQVDGDYIGEYEEASYGVSPRALTVVS
jgi:diacylglycerol kinase family enzyme